MSIRPRRYAAPFGKIVRRIKDDEDAPRSLTVRLKELEAEETKLVTELAQAPDRTVIRLPANYEAVYARAVEQLEHHLTSIDGNPARTAIRGLVEWVVVHAGDAPGGKVRRSNCEATCSGCSNSPRPQRRSAFRES